MERTSATLPRGGDDDGHWRHEKHLHVCSKGRGSAGKRKAPRIKIMHTLEACYGALSLTQGEATQFYVNGDAIKFVIFFFLKQTGNFLKKKR